MATADSITASVVDRRAARRAAKHALRVQGVRRFKVFWLRNNKEHGSPWFSSEARAKKAYDIVASKYGPAVIYVD